MIAAGAAREAQELGIDPREVAAALYASPEPSTAPANKAAERRRLLRMQISALERALGQIEAEHPGVAPTPNETYPDRGPTLLDAEQLEQVVVTSCVGWPWFRKRSINRRRQMTREIRPLPSGGR